MRLMPAMPAQMDCPVCGNTEPTGWQINFVMNRIECNRCGAQPAYGASLQAL